MLRVSKRFLTKNAAVKKTALYDLHVDLEAKLVPFAGYEMPLLYPNIQNHVQSHLWTRKHAGLFDVSHMLQSRLMGTDAIALLNLVTPSKFSKLQEGSGQLSVLLNDQGGIIDDLIIVRERNGFAIVSNASRRDEVSRFISQQIRDRLPGCNIVWEPIENKSLIALQGPTASRVLKEFVEGDLNKLFFGQRQVFPLKDHSDININVMRGGYTGEDGFEIAINESVSPDFASDLLANEQVKPIGLAGRDSLRLEAGMCLYGNELDENTTPVEASLKWLIAKDRRDLAENRLKFNGYDKIIDQLKNKTNEWVRVGFKFSGDTPSPAARHGATIFNNDGITEIGQVTSGSVSPCLSINIGQAYVKNGEHKIGTKHLVQVRKKLFPIEITRMPFVPTHYYKS
ncbi:hypothetical protein KAFR_0E01140 [Kazachstania africana CBS 2517]|uniref:Aminomethyltransferase n=1 Tax=Kazachstania africana (strain ATCC 22294 / BCRC 22015 / CBS 2517 / CECT 1963 / NBRC 1671 / NRRL Y-8276) TaxID=1071382 RepID=H2AV68_KAZAF|nr:hypothetical protein KAFR_0E01140 [Kazachstania africana CBS 2517]CCF58268.1 hypothetical protein KAFR_0E01140 [Kazachstania africana CBS 2517]